jgi:hypothetical protein
LQTIKGSTSAINIRRLALAGVVILGLAGCSGGSNPTDLCTDAIAAKLGDKFKDVQITENIESPIAVDISGIYAGGGSFGCGLSRNPLKLETALVFPFDGPIIDASP